MDSVFANYELPAAAVTTVRRTVRRWLNQPWIQAFVLSLSLVTIIVVNNHHTQTLELAQAAELGQLVDMSGRQRMLTERIFKNCLLLTYQTDQSDVDSLRSQLQADTEKLNSNHAQLQLLVSTELLPNSRESQGSRASLLNASQPLAEITAVVRQVLNDAPLTDSLLQTLQIYEPQLIVNMDRFNREVTAVQAIKNNFPHRLRRQFDFGWLILLTVAVFGLSLLALRKISSSNQRLRKKQRLLLRQKNKIESIQTRLSAAIEATTNGSWYWNPDSDEHWYSATYWQLLGLAESRKSQQWIANSRVDFLRRTHPADLLWFTELVDRALDSAEPFDAEVRLKLGTGEFRWFRIRGRAVSETPTLSQASGRCCSLTGLLEDIDERKTAQLNCTDTDRLLNRVGEVAQIGGWILDLKTRRVTWTQQTYAIHEVEPGYIPTVEQGISFYAPEARGTIQAAVETAIDQGVGWDLELPLITAKGRRIWVRAQGEVEYEQDKPVRLLGVFQEITDRKHAEANFLEMQYNELTARLQLEGVVKSATAVSIIATDATGLITVFSPGASKLLGFTAEEMIGQRRLEDVHFPDQLQARTEQLSNQLGRRLTAFDTLTVPAQQGEPETREWTYITIDGTKRTVDLTVTAICDRDGTPEGYLAVAIDTTNEKADKLQLERLANIASRTTNGVVMTDAEGRVEWINNGFTRLSGYTLEEFRGKTPGSVLQGPESDPETIEMMRRKLRAGESFEAEIVNYHRSGEKYWVYMKVDPIRDDDGQITGFISIESDVTERKRAEQELSESREQMRRLLEGLPAAAYTCNEHGQITYYNKEAAQIWGRQPELDDPSIKFCGSVEMTDRDDQTISHQSSPMATALKERRVIHNSELVIVGQDGTKRVVLSHASPLYNVAGELTGGVNVLIDISDRIKLEKSLRDTTARLELCLRILDQHAVVAETDLSGRIRHVNDVFCKISGYSREELIGQTHAIVNSGLHPQGMWKDVFRQVADMGMWQGEVCNRRKDGTLYWVDTTIAAMRDGNGKINGYFAIRNDITELKQAKEQALAANHSKSEFLANMSHEIRTPLTAILGYADLLNEEPEIIDSPVRRQQALATIRNAGNHLLTIINDILDLSKIEAGKLSIEAIPMSLPQIVHQIETLLRPRAIEKGVQLRTNLLTRVPDQILSDPTRFRQILMNLIGNAIKFTDEGSITLNIRLDNESAAASSSPHGVLLFDIEDTGKGMTPDQRDSIFQAFNQADTSVTRQYGGTGLGLVISRRLSRLMGGDVELVRTEPGQGTCFRLTLPARRCETSELVDQLVIPATSVATKPVANAQVLAGKRILLAEDGIDNQRLICFLLKKMGLDVEVASNGLTALEKMLSAQQSDHPFEILLTDMQMPEMDGYTLARELRQRGVSLPIIALTAHAMADDRDKCLSAGCDDFVSKPINRQNLTDTITSWLHEPAVEP